MEVPHGHLKEYRQSPEYIDYSFVLFNDGIQSPV